MDYPALIWKLSLLALILLTDIPLINSAGVTITSSLQPAVFGESVEISCELSLDSGEQWVTLYIREDNDDNIVIFHSTFPEAWGSGVSESLKNRAYFTQIDQSSTVGTLHINRTECSDMKTYKCYAVILLQGADYGYYTDSTALDLTSLPGKPTLDVVSVDLIENNPVSLTCRGSLGRPAASYHWEIIREGTISPVPLPDEDTTSSAAASPNTCLFEGSSQKKYPVTQQDDGAVVKCYLKRASDGLNGQNNEGYYAMSAKLNVKYSVTNSPVSVRTSPSSVDGSFTEGLSQLTLTCEARGNPLPSYEWKYQADDLSTFVSVVNASQHTIPNLTVNKGGIYRCLATNTVGGNEETGVNEITVTIVQTTIPPTETSTKTTPKDETEPTPQTIKSGGSDDIITIIVVVVVVLALIIAVIILVCVVRMRNRKKQPPIEEPPMKPRNNQDLSLYNKPDLVGDDIKKPYDTGYDNKYNDDALNYADLKFDDKPRSRRPVQVLDIPDYSDVTLPRV